MKHSMRIAAALTCAALLMTALPVHAGYSGPEEIAFRTKARSADNGVFIPSNDSSVIYLSPAAAKAGASVHAGVYIEAAFADLAYIKMTLGSDSPSVTFNGDSFVNPSMYAYDTEQSFTLPEGTTFRTRYAPYALGMIDADGKYSPDCWSILANFKASENALIVTWQHSIGSNVPLSASFLGGVSDAYSFIEFDTDIAAGITPGTYHLAFKGLDNPEDPPTYGGTYVSSDNTPAGSAGSKYVPATPALYGLDIVVAENENEYIDDVFVSSDGSGLRGDVNRDGEVNAADASLVLAFAAADGLSGNASFSDKETENTVRRYLADVNEVDGINAADASAILIYTANAGLTGSADWSSILKG